MTSLRVAAVEGIPGLLVGAGSEERESADAYGAGGGYADDRLDGEALIDAVESSGLRGRGGAAFPTGVKLRSVGDRGGPRVVVANGDEGEPASVKDRWLLRMRPHLVLDGLLLAAAAIEAERAYAYASDPLAEASVELALEELGPVPVPVTVVRVARTYVAGEETAVVRAIDGGPAKPLDKPPRPFEAGVDGRPTLVANVETLANLPLIAAAGPDELRAEGSTRSPGTALLTLSGAVAAPGLYEAPLGISLADALAAAGGTTSAPRGFLMGGFFAGLLPPAALGVQLDYDSLRAEGSGLGCGSIVTLGADDCPVAAAAEVMAYFDRSNARQCGACMRGTAAMAGVLASLAAGDVEDAEIEKLHGWTMSLRGRGACGTLDGAANLAGTLLREFPTEVAEHRASPCERCRRLLDDDPGGDTRYAVHY